MKLKALEPITDKFGSKKGFGDKATGEVFEVSDNTRALELISTGLVEEVKEVIVKAKA